MLHIKFADNLSIELKNYYTKKSLEISTDSGFDLVCPNDLSFTPMESKTIDFKIQCKFTDMNNNASGYLLMPRSSISKTNLMMMNSIGLIDKDYRGNLMAKVKNITITDNEYIKKNDRLFQIVGPNFQPFKVKIVEELDETTRGSGGFGSTGTNI
ncbi:putative deoxyuridine 5'-triphosphate nucleotidohydrolase [Chlorella virus XW01]|nr:putative deoxyuridine 5'-triphosphate nucleotidohydrolase [Chlorella virus XW01]